jgi:glycosyltransferase involved in cell wall biosynthesis
MSNNYLISVIIPCYNQARFLAEALDSVFAQTHPHIEVIVVDDGSTDHTVEIASGFDRVRCLSVRNRGLAAARNAGLEASKGSYLVFLDADDRLLSNALEDGLNCLKTNAECGFAYGHVRLISSDGSPLSIPNQIAVEADHYLELLRHNYIWTPGAVIYRREAVESVGAFNVLFNGSADFDLNVRIARLFPVCCNDRPVLEYRRHDESMSRDYALMLKAAVSVRCAHRKVVKGSKELEKALQVGIRIAQEDYGEKVIELIGHRLRERKWGAAISGLLMLLRYYPQGFWKHARRKLNSFALGVQN